MKPYVAILHAVFEAVDDVAAAVAADQMVLNAERDLDKDEGDEVWVSQIISGDVQTITPDEAILRLRVARNVLIRTRNRLCLDGARELDKLAWQIAHNDLESNSLAGYDYAVFIDVVQAILLRGENPLA